MKKAPTYMYQCIICKKNFYTENTTAKHCGKMMQWIAGLEGVGIDRNSPQVKIKISGYIKMSQESLDVLLAYTDVHKGLIYSMNMGYCNAENVEFDLEG